MKQRTPIISLLFVPAHSIRKTFAAFSIRELGQESRAGGHPVARAFQVHLDIEIGFAVDVPGGHALLDHGQVRAATLDRDLEGASARVEQLRSLGIDVEKVCDELQVAGVKSFADAFDTLFDSITKALA